jgi:hypothetical protein
MDLDNVVKFFAPKGMHISDSVRATASEQLTVTDVMAALGMTQADAGIGLAMYLGKAGVSKQDKEAAIAWLTEYAKEVAPFAVRRLAVRNSRCACSFWLSLPITTMHPLLLIPMTARRAVNAWWKKPVWLQRATTQCACLSGLKTLGNLPLIL